MGGGSPRFLFGISKLDNRIKLVATMDDDVTYEKDAINNMIDFWNECDNNTAGVGFNIINLQKIKYNWVSGVLGFSSKDPGKVLKSGFSTSISNVSENCQVEWLNGGATVWLKEILIQNKHKEMNMSWAVGEDLIFSYPLGLKYPLFICAEAKVNIEEVIVDKEPRKFYNNMGESLFSMGLNFVVHNNDMSRIKFILHYLLYVISLVIKGIIKFDISRYYIAFGIIKSFIKNFHLLILFSRSSSESQFIIK